MDVTNLTIGPVPAVIYGAPSDRGYLFLHGKMGCKDEGADYANIVCPKGWQVLAIDLPEHGQRAGRSSQNCSPYLPGQRPGGKPSLCGPTASAPGSLWRHSLTNP